MTVRAHWRFVALVALVGLPLAACQGNLGSGSGLSIPQGPQPYSQPNGPGAQAVTRERAVDGAVYLASPLPDLPLPTVNGFGIDIALGTPGPSPSASPSAAASAKASRRTKTSYVARPFVVAQVVASPVAAPSAGPSPAPSAGSSAAPAGVSHLSDASPAAGAAGFASPGSPGPSGSPSVRHHTHPAPEASGPKITTKIVAYPEDAPAPPTPEPTGNVQTFPIRSAIVRGYLLPSIDVPIYGLAAIRFTVPKEELTPNRGYTIAVFTSAKKHRGKLLEYDTAPTVSSNEIASSFADDPLVFKKNVGYEIVLYGDQLAATPAPPVPSGFPPAGNNPVPAPSGYPPYPGAPGYGSTPVPPGYATPYPGQTPFH